MTEYEMQAFWTYMFNKCMALAEYYPEYTPNEQMPIDRLVENYMHWAYYKNGCYFPEMQGSGWMCVYLQNAWADFTA